MNVREAERCTPYDYNLLIKAKRLSDVDRSYWQHLQAWTDENAGATKKNGQRVYKRFNQFFDYDKHLEDTINPKQSKTLSIADANRRLSKARKEKR